MIVSAQLIIMRSRSSPKTLAHEVVGGRLTVVERFEGRLEALRRSRAVGLDVRAHVAERPAVAG